MILTYGDVAKLKGSDWYMVELCSESANAMEASIRRVAKALPSIFREHPVEVFVPIADRNLNVFDLNTGSYLYARSSSFDKLFRLKTVTGVVGLSTIGGSNHPSHAIKVEDSFVQQQIAIAKQAANEHAASIAIGSFVRVLDGEMRDWCGTVTNMHDGVAVVRVPLKTKIMLIETSVRNLRDMSHVPEDRRVFFYSEMVESLSDDEVHLIAEDLEYHEPPPPADDTLSVEKPSTFGRQQTVTAAVKRMIILGNLDPKSIGVEVVNKLREGSIRMPRNITIVHGIIKSYLLKHLATKGIKAKNYRDLVEQYPEYRFSLHDMMEIAGDTIPV